MEIYERNGYWLNKKGEGAETVKEWIRYGDLKYDHIELMKQKEQYFIVAFYREQDSTEQVRPVNDEGEIEKLKEGKADYNYVVNLFKSL